MSRELNVGQLPWSLCRAYASGVVEQYPLEDSALESRTEEPGGRGEVMARKGQNERRAILTLCRTLRLGRRLTIGSASQCKATYHTRLLNWASQFPCNIVFSYPLCSTSNQILNTAFIFRWKFSLESILNNSWIIKIAYVPLDSVR